MIIINCITCILSSHSNVQIYTLLNIIAHKITRGSVGQMCLQLTIEAACIRILHAHIRPPRQLKDLLVFVLGGGGGGGGGRGRGFDPAIEYRAWSTTPLMVTDSLVVRVCDGGGEGRKGGRGEKEERKEEGEEGREGRRGGRMGPTLGRITCSPKVHYKSGA